MAHQHTVPFTLVHAGKNRTRDKLLLHTLLKLRTNPEKATQRYKTTANKTALVYSPLMTLGQETTQRSRAHGGSLSGNSC